MNSKLTQFRQAWSINQFDDENLSDFANQQLLDETQQGVITMSLLLAGFVLVALGYFNSLDLNRIYTQNFFWIAVLAIHTIFSARVIHDINALHLLGMTLLIISTTAFVLITHETTEFIPLLIANIVLLFMVIPMVPWSAKEASLVILIIYLLLTISSVSTSGRFDSDVIWALQYFMLAAGITSLLLVIRNSLVRKKEIITHFKLNKANDELLKISNQDPLTGAWNRRFLETAKNRLFQAFHTQHDTFHFIICDLDDFKLINDQYGHEFGDKVLVDVKEVFNEQIADTGYLIRIGGDEFILLLVHHQPEKVMMNIIESIRGRISKLNSNVDFGMSWGMASAPLQQGLELKSLYDQADRELYSSKKNNRKRERRSTTDSTVMPLESVLD